MTDLLGPLTKHCSIENRQSFRPPTFWLSSFRNARFKACALKRPVTAVSSVWCEHTHVSIKLPKNFLKREIIHKGAIFMSY
jgi:hypothetical protein